MIQELHSCQESKTHRFNYEGRGAMMSNGCIKKHVGELILSIYAAIRHTRHLAFNPLEESSGFCGFTIVLLNGQVKRTEVRRWREFVHSEGIDEGD